MSLPLILLAVLLGMAWDCGTWGAKRHGRDFYYGAMLLVPHLDFGLPFSQVARDGKSIFNFAGRCLEVGTVAVLIFGFGMGVMWWGFWRLGIDGLARQLELFAIGCPCASRLT